MAGIPKPPKDLERLFEELQKPPKQKRSLFNFLRRKNSDQYKKPVAERPKRKKAKTTTKNKTKIIKAKVIKKKPARIKPISKKKTVKNVAKKRHVKKKTTDKKAVKKRITGKKPIKTAARSKKKMVIKKNMQKKKITKPLKKKITKVPKSISITYMRGKKSPKQILDEMILNTKNLASMNQLSAAKRNYNALVNAFNRLKLDSAAKKVYYNRIRIIYSDLRRFSIRR